MQFNIWHLERSTGTWDKLPISFSEMWQTNFARNPERALRNANDYYIPPHRVETVKRMPIVSLPTAWNSAPGDKFNPKQHLYLKKLKELLLSAILSSGVIFFSRPVL
jgi:hypothetical protein